MKRIYAIIAGLSFAQMLVLSGFAVTLAVRGAFTPQRVEGALRALRGDGPIMPTTSSQPASAPASHGASASQPREIAAEDEDAVRARRIEFDRREREIADQWAMLRTAQVELIRDKEKLDHDRKQSEAALKKQAETLALSGASKELEYLSSIKADIARDILKRKKDADAVALLLQMETRTGRKIIESCKTDEERLWIGRIIEQLRGQNSNQAEDLNARTTHGTESTPPHEPPTEKAGESHE